MKKILILLLLLSSTASWGVDIYSPNENTLYIPIVKVSSRYYKDVVVSVKEVISVNVIASTSAIDTFDSIRNELTIPLVLVGTTAYTNVVITIANVNSVGGESSSGITACTQVNRKLGDVLIPEGYKGNYAEPKPAGKLPSAISRTMSFKDLDAWYSKPKSNTCEDKIQYLSNAYIESLNRVKELGVDTVWIYNYGYWDDFRKSLWSISPADFAIPKEVMSVIAAEAKRRDIKVFMSWQMNNSDKVSAWNSLDNESLSEEKLTILMNSFKSHMTEMAKFSNSIGIYGLAGDMGAFVPGFLKTDLKKREIYISKTIETIESIRKVFSGKIAYGLYDSPLDNRIVSMIDQLHFVMFLSGTHTYAPYSVDLMKMVAGWQINFAKDRINKEGANLAYTKPIIWEIYAQSTSDFYFKNGYMEDSFCFDPCGQLNLQTDFSAQAIAVEAAFQAIVQDKLFQTAGVTLTNYWLGDEVTPTQLSGIQTSFPNIASSVRNKPAELIVKYWYEK
jgi:hypothetical protein